MYHEVSEIVFNRADDVLRQNRRFLILAEWLNARFPCDTLEPQVWRAGAVDGRSEKRVLVLDICDMHEEVVAYIVYCAAKLSLSVADIQSEKAFPGSGGRVAGQEFFDEHCGFRAELIRAGPLLQLPLPLVSDLFRAEAMVCTSINRLRWGRVAELFCSLLSRGGVAELTLCAQCIPTAWLIEEKMTALPFAADMAESLRHACEKRAVNPKLRDQAGHYAALEKYFADFAVRGRR